MITMQGFRYALYRSRPMEAVFRRVAGARRFIWNEGLRVQVDAQSRGEPVPRYAALCALLPKWKIEYPWLKEVHSQVLQQALKDLDRVWAKRFKDLAALKQRAMKRDAMAGAPSFRRRGEGETFRYPQPKPEHVDIENGRVFLPKIGWMRYRNSRPPEGKVKQITLLQEAGRWIVSLTMEVEKALESGDQILGADQGVTDTLAISDGRCIAPLNAHRNALPRLKRYQRSVGRKIEAQKVAMGLDPKAPFPKGVRPKKSNRQRRAESKVVRCHRHIAAQRRDWLHKLSTTLADEAAVLVLEDLKLKSMTASAAGTLEEPGRKVAQKSGLNRSMLDQGLGRLVSFLDYKLAWRGGRIIKVPAPYTSQRCSCCGHVDTASRKGKRFLCTQCGTELDADINAARNILAAGLAVLAGKKQARYADVEDSALSGRPVKRQSAQTEGGATCADHASHFRN